LQGSPGEAPREAGDEIRTLFSYNRWANHRLVDASEPLSPSDFTREPGTSHGSLRGTLVHTLWSEWIWLQRWRGTSPKSPKQVFAESQFPHVAAIGARWAEVERDREHFLGGLTEDRLRAPVAYENLHGQRWEYPLDHMMQHVVNHSSYHRGQVVTLLRQLGRTPPTTDSLVFFDEGGR
jgi:uncharacterized damage-inducible protein DinB